MDTTIAYTLKIIEQLKGQKTNNNVEFEVSHQKGDGAHLFDFMGKVRSFTYICHSVFMSLRKKETRFGEN